MRSPGSPLVLAALVAAACSSSASEEAEPEAGEDDPPAAPADAAPARPVEVETAEPDGPHLSLSLLGRYRDPSFGAAGLPAISADRRRVAYPHQLQDGGRGNPNLTLVIRDVESDSPLDSIEVLAVEPRWTPEREAEVRLRLAAANARLAEGEWRAMAAPDYEGAGLAGGAVLEIGEYRVRVRAGRLEIAWGGRTRWDRDVGRWLGLEPVPGCAFRPELGEAWAGGGALLVRIDFAGDPGCWREPAWRVIDVR